MEPGLQMGSGKWAQRPLGVLGSPPLAVSPGVASKPCPTTAVADSGVLESPTLAVWRKRAQGRALLEAGRPADGTPSARPHSPCPDEAAQRDYRYHVCTRGHPLSRERMADRIGNHRRGEMGGWRRPAHDKQEARIGDCTLMVAPDRGQQRCRHSLGCLHPADRTGAAMGEERRARRGSPQGW